MTIAWNTEKRKISSLKENPKNPRKLTKEQAEHLRKSLERFGQCEPIVCNLDGTIIGGHQRIRTLKKQGIKEVDVSVPDRELTEKEVDELGIRLNKNGGEFDYKMLANSFDPIELCEWGFKAEELDIDVSVIQESEKEDKPKKEKVCPNCGFDL